MIDGKTKRIDLSFYTKKQLLFIQNYIISVNPNIVIEQSAEQLYIKK